MRCGKCATVFDGIAQLVQPEGQTPVPQASPQLGLFDPSRQSRVAPSAAGANEPATESTPLPPPESPAPPEALVEAEAKPQAASQETQEELQPEPQRELQPELQLGPPPADHSPLPAEAVDEPVVLEDFLAEPPKSRRRLATVLWSAIVLVALAGLLAQLSLRYRSELAVLAPFARAALVNACRFAGCDVRLPRRPELVSIESSELQSDPRRENLIQLDAVLRNRAPFAQEFPALELTLIDDAEAPVVRRVLFPAEYLPGGLPLAAPGMPAQSETSLRLQFDNSQVRATGYRLYLFYP